MFLFIGVAIATASSCKKDDDTNDDENNNPSTKKCYVSKIINDDDSYTDITFNTDHLITKIEDFDDEGNVDGYTTISYTSGKANEVKSYNSNDDLESKMEVIYDANGKVDKIDIYADNPGTGMEKVAIYEYTFSGDNLSKFEIYFEYNGNMILFSKKEFTFDAGNITSMKNYKIDITTLQLSYDGKTEYQYDTKNNPAHGVGIEYIFGEFWMLSKNNIITKTVSDDTGAIQNDESVNVVYEYNDNKYPTKQTITSFDNSHSEVTRYEYNCE